MAYKDKNKQLAAQRKWYKENKDKVKTKRRKNRIKRRQWMYDYKKTIKCSMCPESHPACIDFHHILGKKFKEISIMVNFEYSKERIMSEIKKCIPLCANCHRKKHFKMVR